VRRGEGVHLWDVDGNRYLDMTAGIAVCSLGHCHPALVRALMAQAEQLLHASNLYHIEQQIRAAQAILGRCFGDRVFFCNSGAEANETAIKYARKATGKPGIVALEGSFHGRTLGTLSVTGQPGKRQAFEPLVPGVSFAQLNDVASLESAVGPETGLILIEPVQGEGGVRPASPGFLAAAAELAAEHGALLCLDEVQTGVGRTGTFFAYEQLGVRPQLLTLAKGLANGLPVGALLVADEAAGAFVPGDHATTFGGNPVVCAAACAVVEAVDEELLANVRDRSAQLAEALPARGTGLLLGLETARPAAAVVGDCFDAGLLVTAAGENVLRLTPPLTVSTDEVAQAVSILQEVFK
jgi:predicted acetylornithine/succinylornithine family transaminase